MVNFGLIQMMLHRSPLTGNNFSVFPPLLWSRISHRQLPEFDEVLKVSAWDEEMKMPGPEKKFIFIALPAGGGCDSTCVHPVCNLNFTLIKHRLAGISTRGKL